MTEQTIEQLRAELVQMQLDANAVCQSLGVKWAADGNYPSFAVQAVGTLRGRAARGEWQRDEAQAELAQARAELKDLQVANRVCEKRLEHQTHTHNFWFKTCLAAEAERDEARKEAQEQSDEVQEHWLSPAEAEGLRRQLKHAEDAHTYRFKEYDALEIDLCHAAKGEAAIVEAAEALLKQPYIFVGNPAESTMEIAAASKKLQATLEHRSDAAAKLLERLATLDAAEAALAECGLGGFETQFDGLPNAIEGMAEHIKELSGQLSEAELAAHVYDRSCGELAQTVRTERAERRQLAEMRAGRNYWLDRHDDIAVQLAQVEARLIQAQADLDAEPIEIEITGQEMVEALQAERRLRREAEQRAEGALATARKRATRMGEAERRANKAVNQLSRAGERERQANQRAERAEALAALVTLGLPVLLTRLASCASAVAADYEGTPEGQMVADDARTARKLAAQIGEALDDSQA